MSPDNVDKLRARVSDLEAEVADLRKQAEAHREVHRMEAGDLDPSCESVLQVLVDNAGVPMTALHIAERTGLALDRAQCNLDLLVKRKLVHDYPRLLAGWKYSATTGGLGYFQGCEGTAAMRVPS